MPTAALQLTGAHVCASVRVSVLRRLPSADLVVGIAQVWGSWVSTVLAMAQDVVMLP